MEAKTRSVIDISLPAARIAIAAAVTALLLLAGLHMLSPEFDPSWRMVSEYANGHYGWVLSLMFASWAVSSWSLAFAIRSQAGTRAGKIGLGFLVAAGVGEAMAVIFDNNHPPLHDMAGYISILSLPIAAILISVSLGRTQLWSATRKALLWTANLTWASVVLLAATFIAMIVSYTQAGGDMTANAVKVLPPGVIGLVGWANRLLVIVYCVWVITVAWQAIQLRRGKLQ
jgi:hypothetical membrane protein